MKQMGRAAQLRWAVLYAQAFTSNQAVGWAMQTTRCFGQALLSGTQSYSLQYVELQTQFPVQAEGQIRLKERVSWPADLIWRPK